MKDFEVLAEIADERIVSVAKLYENPQEALAVLLDALGPFEPSPDITDEEVLQRYEELLDNLLEQERGLAERRRKHKTRATTGLLSINLDTLLERYKANGAAQEHSETFDDVYNVLQGEVKASLRRLKDNTKREEHEEDRAK